MTDEQPKICVLKVSLEESSPLIWRQIVVPYDVTLDCLHMVLQIAMGWEVSHLYEFDIQNQQYADLELIEDAPSSLNDVGEISLKSLAIKRGDRFEYTYDLGDNWNHIIEVEDLREAKAFEPDFGCRAGEMACPPEDCGGLGGYDEIIAAKKDPKHPRREEIHAWINLDDFDPEEFNIDSVNELIQLELLMEEEQALALLEDLGLGSKSEANGEDTESEVEPDPDDQSSLLRSLALATNNQLMRDEPPETRSTLERLVNDGVDIEEAFAMIVAAVGEELFESISLSEQFNNERLLKRFEQLPESSRIDSTP